MTHNVLMLFRTRKAAWCTISTSLVGRIMVSQTVLPPSSTSGILSAGRWGRMRLRSLCTAGDYVLTLIIMLDFKVRDYATSLLGLAEILHMWNVLHLMIGRDIHIIYINKGINIISLITDHFLDLWFVNISAVIAPGGLAPISPWTTYWSKQRWGARWM